MGLKQQFLGTRIGDMMVVDNLELMEQIVESNKNLEWDGWTVVEYHQRPTSFYDANAVYRNGRWYKVSRYSVLGNGWTIPDRLFKAFERRKALQSVEG